MKEKKSGLDTLKNVATELVENFEIGGIPNNTIKNTKIMGVPDLTVDKFAKNFTETGSGLLSKEDK